MNFAATYPLDSDAALLWSNYRPNDRSLGIEARSLRSGLDKAIAPASAVTVAPASAYRASEILSRLQDAITQARESDGTTVSFMAFVKTLEFMTSLPTELPLPIVVVESEDEIGLDWDEDDQRVVSLTIDNSDQIGFSALLGRELLCGRAEICVDRLSKTLRNVLGQLYPSAPLS